MNTAEQPPFVPGPIQCASDVPLSDSSSGVPNMSTGLLDYFRPLRIGVVTATPQDGADDPRDDGVVKETVRWVDTSGMVQPGKTKLEIKPGGERSWKAYKVFTSPDFNVPTDTKLRIQGTLCRITGKDDWSASGYVYYELLEDYESGS